MSITHNPVSTYRLQLWKGFNFQDLKNIFPYLKSLGVKTIYASPIFEAAPGSTHGYDGTDPNAINPEIGTIEELYGLSALCRQNGMQWVQDIVPNHLSFHENNKWLIDVLTHGKQSAYASCFDIIWNHPVFADKLMVPFPGSPLETYLKQHIPDAAHYQLTDWRETERVINYRRFFTVNSLICTDLRSEDVFVRFHRLIARLVQDEVFDGLRVDHIDGLHDPKNYLQRLRLLAGEKVYVVVEKILEPGEELKTDWDIQGTTGYEFLGAVNNLLTNPAGEQTFNDLYVELTGDTKAVEDQVKEKKSAILFEHMGGELDNLTRLYRAAGGGRDKPDEQIRKEIGQYLVDCPVYRFYGSDIPVMPDDKGTTDQALLAFYRRAMQFTGPIMAKGVEDTLMYTYNRFIGHNDVGDSPALFGMTTAEFHKQMINRQEHWPLSLNTTSTHDTKRGEDARARLNVLTDLYGEWAQLVREWITQNAAIRTNEGPDANDEYFVYQTLIASYPFLFDETDEAKKGEELATYRQRITEYLQKSLREAKVHTNYTEPNDAYENATIKFAHDLIDGANDFHKKFMPFLRRVADLGMINSFTQTTLKFMCPGVPDTYQGTELWDLSLVDPDNRRPVDYKTRKEMLLTDMGPNQLWQKRASGENKLALVRRLLRIRSEYDDILTKGDYVPLELTGAHADHAIAFIRTREGRSLLVVAALHPGLITDVPPAIDWKDTAVAIPDAYDDVWKSLIGSNTVGGSSVSDLLRDFPVGVFASQ